MNISPIGSYYAPPLERVAPRATAAPVQAAPAASVQAGPAAGMEIPVQAPQGTDDKLWSVLTSEERSYFGRTRGTSHGVYGPSGITNSLAARGQALNIRV